MRTNSKGRKKIGVMVNLKRVMYEEEGVATAVGAILVILIFIFLLSLFITSYVPAEMTSYEEQYSTSVTNDMMQFVSSIGLLSLNFQQGETVSVTYDLQSGYVPLFATPTVGELSLTPSTSGSSGYMQVGNSTMNLSAGGSLSVLTNNRYFVDEAFYYEASTLFYEQYGSSPLINSTLQFNLIQTEPPSNGSINMSMNLVNIMGGPISFSSQSPFTLSATALSKSSYLLRGNITLNCSSSLASQLYPSLLEELSGITGVHLSRISEGNGYEKISIYSVTSPISMNIKELNLMVGINS
jgi:hypothetical protein